MTEPVFFVVERTPAGETPAIYYDRMPAHLTSYKPLKNSLGKPIVITDLKGKVIELNPIIYALRLDRLPNGHELVDQSLGELYSGYCRLRDKGSLPPSNLADPPRAKGEQGTLHGESFTVRNPPWDRRPGVACFFGDFCGDCGDFILPGGHHQVRSCPEYGRRTTNEGEKSNTPPAERGGYIGLRRGRV